MSKYKMVTPRRKWRYSVVLALLLVGLLTAIQLQDRYFKLSKNLEIFADILKELDAYYVEEVDPDAVVKSGIDAMLSSLDPYTNFIAEEDLESFKTFTSGEYGGIGAIIGNRKGKTIVFMLYKDCPAHKGGLHVGDEIIMVNGEKVTDKPVAHVSSLLKGMPSTQVQVSVVRQVQGEPLEMTLTREKVTLKNVPYFGKVQKDVGYIRLANFTIHAADEVKAALEALKSDGISKLILDLRGNPGGILEEAIKTANLFVDKDLTVVGTKSKIAEMAKTYCTEEPAYDSTIPMIVLIDQQSASAAEIVAGVVQDYDRGVLIGKSTFGKGLVQTTRPLSYNTQLKLTTAKYYIPSGRSIQKIDYGRKQQEKGAEGAVDTPKEVFTTRAGRAVYDGSGITPDIEAEKLDLAPITISLSEKGLIFDYANLFQAKHNHVAPPKEFSLSENQYQDFVRWLKDKEYPYTIERGIDQLLEQAQNESYHKDIGKQIAALRAQVQHYREADLQKFKKEIKLLLKEAIVSRYYFQEGAIESMLDYDLNVQKARALFQNMDEYHTLLKGINP